MAGSGEYCGARREETEETCGRIAKVRGYHGRVAVPTFPNITEAQPIHTLIVPMPTLLVCPLLVYWMIKTATCGNSLCKTCYVRQYIAFITAIQYSHQSQKYLASNTCPSYLRRQQWKHPKRSIQQAYCSCRVPMYQAHHRLSRKGTQRYKKRCGCIQGNSHSGMQ